MHIMFLTAEYPPQPGGVGDYTRCLAKALAACGHQVDILTGCDDGKLRIFETTSHLTSNLQPPTFAWGWRSWRAVGAIVAREQPDILHIQYQTGAYGMHPAVNMLPRYLAMRGLRDHTRIAVTFHDLLEPYLFPKAGRLRRWVTLRLAHDADLVVVTNADDAGRLADRGRRTKGKRQLHIIPIGSNIPVAPPQGYSRASWRATFGVETGETLVAYFGLLSRSKGVDLLLDALKQLDEASRLHWKLLLIGGAATAPQDRDYAAKIVEQIAHLGLEGRIIRTGQVDEASVSAHLLAADLVALPFRDGASFRRGSLLAALAHGCAIVTTQTQDAARMTENGELPRLEDGEHALLVPPSNSAALAQALQQLAGDQELRRHLSQGAQALAAHFSWDTIARLHEEIYRSHKAED